MKVKVLNFNKPDEQGDVFTSGSIKFSNPVKVLKEFKPHEVMFSVNVEEKKDGFYADFPEDESIKGLFPAVGYQIVTDKSHYKLFAIGLSITGNIDPEIMPL